MKRAKKCYRGCHGRTIVGFSKMVGDLHSARDDLKEYGIHVEVMDPAELFFRREKHSHVRTHVSKSKSWKRRCKKVFQWERHQISDAEIWRTGCLHKEVRKSIIARIGRPGVRVRLEIRNRAEYECLCRMRRDREIVICDSNGDFLSLEAHMTFIFVVLKKGVC